MNQGQLQPHVFLKCENSFPCQYIMECSNSTFVGFKKSSVLATGVSLVNKICK